MEKRLVEWKSYCIKSFYVYFWIPEC